MKTNENYENSAGIWIFAFLFITAVLVIFHFSFPYIKIVRVEVPEDKPMINFLFGSWGINAVDNSKYLFSGWVTNYGLKEAKNVQLSCFIFSSAGELIKTETQNIGNIASTSTKYAELNTNYMRNLDSTGTCVVKCENCINLDERLPEMKKYYDILNKSLLMPELI